MQDTIFVHLLKLLHLINNIQVVLKWQFCLNLSLKIILTPNHACLINNKYSKEAKKPWQDSQFKIEALPDPPDIIFLNELNADKSWSRLIIGFPDSLHLSLIVSEIFILYISIIWILWLHPLLLYQYQLWIPYIKLFRSNISMIKSNLLEQIIKSGFSQILVNFLLEIKYKILVMGARNDKIKRQDTILPKIPDMYTEISEQMDSISHPQLPSVKKYTILLNKNEKEEYEKQLKFRQKHREQLIQIMYGQVLQDRIEYLKAVVYVQQMVLNLQQLQNFHFLDMMSIFHKVFKGFKVLYENYGPFEPDPRMICFNEEAVVKVWSNVKYSKPKPKVTYRMLNEQLMVESLTQIFMNKVDLDTLQIDSRRRRFKFSANSFDEAIKIIESHVQSVDLIPKSINVIKNLLISGRKINKDEIISLNSEFYHDKLQKTIKFSYSKQRQNSLGKQGDKKKCQNKVSFSYGRKQEQYNPEKTIKKSKSLMKFNYLDSKSTIQPLKSANIKIPANKINQFYEISPKNTEKDTEIESLRSSNHIPSTKSTIKFTYT